MLVSGGSVKYIKTLYIDLIDKVKDESESLTEKDENAEW